MDLRGTYNSFSRFSEDEPPHILYHVNRAHPKLKRNLFEASDSSDELVQVYLRVKPTNVPNSLYAICDNHSFVTSVDTTSAGHGRRTQNNVSKMYTFSHIFGPDASQKEIFDHIVKNNLRKLATERQNYTLLTYGASGSGKTYTLMGTEASPGLVPRSLEYLFKLVDAAQYPIYKPVDGQAHKLSYDQQSQELQWLSKLCHVSVPLRDKYSRMSVRLSTDFAASTIDLTEKTQYYIWVSFVEIYNEAIYDLLVPGDRKTSSKLTIREDSNGNVYVKNARHAFVRSGAEAYDVMVAGQHNLQVAATGVHANSSRSHCIFTITLLMDTSSGVKISSVKLCDLAGSERANRTRNTGVRMAESRAINTSLHVLERCLHALRRNQSNVLVPYRESKLTRLLGSGLSGARGEPVTMLVTVNTSPRYINETKHVLQLASVAKDIQINNTVFNFEQSSTLSNPEDISLSFNSEIMKLRSENERLEFELEQLIKTNKMLQASIDEERSEHARNAKEIVQEVKDMTKEYYEAQIASMEKQHKAEMDEVLGELQAAKESNSINKYYILVMVSLIQASLGTDATLTTNKLIKQLRLYIEKKEDDEELYQRPSVTEDLIQSDTDYKRKTCSTIDVSSRENSYIEDDHSKDVTIAKSNKHSVPSQNNTFNTTHEDNELYDSVINESRNKTSNDSDSILSNKESVTANSIAEQLSTRGTYFVRSSGNIPNSDLLNNLDEIEKKDDQNISVEHIQNKDNSIDDIEGNCSLDDNSDPSKADKNKLTSPIRISSTEVKMYDKPNSVEILETNFISKIISIDSNISSTMDNEGIESPLENKLKNGTFEISRESDEKADITVSNISKVISIDSNFNISLDNKDIQSPLEGKLTKTHANNFKTSVTRECSVNDGSLTLFEKFEDAISKEIAEQNKPEVKTESPFFTYKKKTSYFNNLKDIEDKNIEDRSENTTILNKSPYKSQIKHKLTSKEMSLDIFESPQIEARETDRITDACIEKLERSTNNLSLVHDYKKPNTTDFFTYNDINKINDNVENDESSKIKVNVVQCSNDTYDLSVSQNANITKPIENDTLDAFENICKDMTTSRATEFDLLLKNESTTQKTSKKDEFELPNSDINNTKNSKYNLRNKRNAENKSVEDKLIKTEETELTGQTRTKRMLRLRKCRNIDEGDKIKLQNIENLKDEFCDVISYKPEPPKVKREQSLSPEKPSGDEENVPPSTLQSCPAPSTARSRRKLFTPRAEPLDQSEGDSGEPLRVPRPSFPRGKARRRL